MKEFLFVRQNKKKWLGYEALLDSGNGRAEDLATAYQETLADLAYAQTQYPDSQIVIYLNAMAKNLHRLVYSPRVFSLKQVLDIFVKQVPRIIADARRELLLALVLFLSFVAAGVIFSVRDESFISEQLGYYYVRMTLNNIANGEPTAVYSGGKMVDSFLGIMYNNLWVTFKMFGSGILPLVGPIEYIKTNGLMLGAFQTLFFLHDVGFRSMTAIWIHGAFEISSLIIAAGAAFRLSTGWVFPGTYTRSYAFRKTATESVKILASTVPLFIVAAFFEGFVTRQVQYPLFVKLLFIFGSFSFIIYYYVVLPIMVYRRDSKKKVV